MKKLSLIFLLFLASCASTRIVSSRNPDYDIPQFKKILVIASSGDLSERLDAENIFAKELDRTELEGVPYLSIFSPEKHYSAKEAKVILDRNGVDGTMVIIRTDEFNTHQYLEPEYFNLAVMSGWNDMSYQPMIKGANISKEVSKFKISLLNRKRKRIWTADTTTEGRKESAIYKSIARSVVENLIRDGITSKQKM